MHSSQSRTAGDRAVGRQQAVVEPVVAVDDGGRALLGDASRERVVDLVDHGQLAGLRLLPLAVPALELALDVALRAAEVAEADGVGVDGVDAGQHVGDLVARRGRGRSTSSVCAAVGVADHEALDEAHDVERRAVHRLVGAQPDDRRHRHVGRRPGPR